MHGINELNGDSGEIVSPLYPSKFFAHSTETTAPSWRITVESGATIYFRFSVFELEIDGWSSTHSCLSTLTGLYGRLFKLSSYKELHFSAVSNNCVGTAIYFNQFLV